MNDESARLLDQYRGGDPQAAGELFDRYVNRLIALARSRMSERLVRRVDPEDVVQSVYRTFFCRARDGRYVLERSGDLWRLLAAITVNKVLRQVERHQQQKRSMDREQPLDASDPRSLAVPAEFVSRDPSPSEAVAMIEELEHLINGLLPLERQMLELRLQGQRVEEIATAVSRSERTVRRVLEKVETTLEQRLREDLG